MFKNIDWKYIGQLALIFVVPLVVFALPALYFGEAPVDAWLAVAGCVVLFIAGIFAIERLEH